MANRRKRCSPHVHMFCQCPERGTWQSILALSKKDAIHEANWHLSLSHQICAYMYTHLLHMCTADLNTCMYSVETQFSIYHRNVPTEEQGCNDWATLMFVYCLLNWKSLSEIRTDICFCKCICALRLLLEQGPTNQILLLVM